MPRVISRTIALAILLSAATIGSVAAQHAATQSEAVRPFKIHVDDSVLTDLKQRLARTRFPGEINNSSWDYGTNLAYLKELVAYWRDKYDWRSAERRLNQFDQFTTTIDG